MKIIYQVCLFVQILDENSKSCGALLGRGTAYAFMRKLDIAIADFTKVQTLSLFKNVFCDSFFSPGINGSSLLFLTSYIERIMHCRP